MSMPPLLNGPQALYSNPPIQPQFYIPQRFVISALVLGNTTFVTTSVDHDYVIAQECRLIIPQGYGCRQLNEARGYVISIPSSTQVELDINSLGGDPFIAANLRQEPQILAIGDINEGSINRLGPKHTHPYIPGSFRNISPQS